jgi:hypothetical protein
MCFGFLSATIRLDRRAIVWSRSRRNLEHKLQTAKSESMHPIVWHIMRRQKSAASKLQKHARYITKRSMI